MNIEVDEIFEKELLIDSPSYGKWKPDTNLLMHVASFDDWGGLSDIESSKQEMIEEGLNPRHVRLRLMVHVEYLD